MNLSFYIDETTFHLYGESCLRYGIIVMEDTRAGISGSLAIRIAAKGFFGLLARLWSSLLCDCEVNFTKAG
jgi:hypothetical protein